ncbi:MAG: hypothetical protein HWQ23_30235 [Nostoc sp. JL33]|uniref:hypothetical protein n=1 Tax=Nostoc sp. JL33 TaxID=2815396 RepID=UPI0025D67E78|nr:hypothetical protein [Nostoc sp. JL33]MBN3874392.1 hypothetical protein [Nostoc sp. JL33]
MPNAQCPMPNAQCPMPNAPFPIPHSEIIRLQHPSGTSEKKIASYLLIWGASR